MCVRFVAPLERLYHAACSLPGTHPGKRVARRSATCNEPKYCITHACTHCIRTPPQDARTHANLRSMQRSVCPAMSPTVTMPPCITLVANLRVLIVLGYELSHTTTYPPHALTRDLATCLPPLQVPDSSFQTQWHRTLQHSRIKALLHELLLLLSHLRAWTSRCQREAARNRNCACNQ